MNAARGGATAVDPAARTALLHGIELEDAAWQLALDPLCALSVEGVEQLLGELLPVLDHLQLVHRHLDECDREATGDEPSSASALPAWRASLREASSALEVARTHLAAACDAFAASSKGGGETGTV